MRREHEIGIVYGSWHPDWPVFSSPRSQPREPRSISGCRTRHFIAVKRSSGFPDVGRMLDDMTGQCSLERQELVRWHAILLHGSARDNERKFDV